ncbi:mucin-7-like [Macrobrachium rosenbergii]|uniref:mucin-7-like n=1 Tax=Macrobrachium rosenbergii TaxID=79674 RepID=UPI0034D53396
MPGPGCGGGYTLVTDMTPGGPVKLRVLHAPPVPSSTPTAPASPLPRTHLRERRMGVVLSSPPKELAAALSVPFHKQLRRLHSSANSSVSKGFTASPSLPPHSTPALAPSPPIQPPTSSFRSAQTTSNFTPITSLNAPIHFHSGVDLLPGNNRTTTIATTTTTLTTTTSTTNAPVDSSSVPSPEEASSSDEPPSGETPNSPAAILERLQATNAHPWLSVSY